MSTQAYAAFNREFTPAQVEAQLIGDLEKGFNVCEEICDRWAEGDRIGLYYEGVERPASQHSFAELKAKSARFANYLSAQGIGKGDRVAGLLPRTPELLVVILGTLRAGAVYQPLFTAFGSGAIEYRLGRAGTRLVVTDGANRSKLDTVKGCPPILLVGRDTGAPEYAGDADFEIELGAQSDSFAPVRIQADEPFLQMFTSGTVGKAKGVAVPARALLSTCAMPWACSPRTATGTWRTLAGPMVCTMPWSAPCCWAMRPISTRTALPPTAPTT
jgi:acetyl-CoA synthetase